MSGEVAPDGGCRVAQPWPACRALEQDVSAFDHRSSKAGSGESAANRSVFDEVAAGLGALGEIVAGVSPCGC